MRAIFYHGVVEREEGDHYYASNFADRRTFEAEVTELAKHWQPMSLAEVDQHRREGTPLPPRAVHVSFDDGFASTMLAAEILQRHRVPWTLFVIVDPLLDGYRPWFTRVADAIGATANVRRLDGSVVELDTPAAKRRFAHELKAQLMAAPASRHEELLDELLGLPGIQLPAAESWPLLRLDEVRELHASGVEIGNHSGRHLNLNRCDARTLHHEVEGSRRRLEAALQAPVRWFSYPDGRFRPRVARAAALGHDLATSVWHPGTRSRPMAIPRRAGGLGTLDRALAGRADLTSCVEWLRWNAPMKTHELRHRARASVGRQSDQSR
jgi:peptidoglycan/xylan/chitin deacetylase (PgdA/CDA1 family)